MTESVREHAEGDWDWSLAGERKLKGVGEVKLYRARRAERRRLAARAAVGA